jgi:hypothetical protein
VGGVRVLKGSVSSVLLASIDLRAADKKWEHIKMMIRRRGLSLLLRYVYLKSIFLCMLYLGVLYCAWQTGFG